MKRAKPRSTKGSETHIAGLCRRTAPITRTNHPTTQPSPRKRWRPTPQLVPTRQPHNLEARRRTDEAIQPPSATPTLNLERLATQLATTLRQHHPSLSIRCIGGSPLGGERQRGPRESGDGPHSKKGVEFFWSLQTYRLRGQRSYTLTPFFPHGVYFVAHGRLSRNNIVSVKQGTTARGYGGKHQALRKKLAVLVASGAAVCWRCGRPILPGMAWDLGHDDLDRSIYRGVECRRCNRSSAASRGNRMRGNPKRRRQIMRVFDDSRSW
jgi:hypothetical protein